MAEYRTEVEAIRFHPDGDHIAFIDHPVRGDNTGVVAVIDLDGQKRTIIDGASHNIAWSSDGREIWSSWGRAITASTLDGEQRVVYRAPAVLWIQDIAPDGRWVLTVENPFSGPRFTLLPTGPGERRQLAAGRA